MNINTVAENLRQTIKNKEAYLAQLREDITKYNQTVNYTVAKFLEININELKVILFDVEKCCEKATLDSWRENPDRMGGQFSEDEINNSTRWQ